MKEKGKRLNLIENQKGRSYHNSIPIRLSGPPPINRQFLKKKYINENLSCQQIADIIGGITRQGIWKALKRYEVAIRSKKDALFYIDGNKCKVSQGYLWIYQPDHHRANGGYVKRATIVIEEKLARPLQNGEFPHHLNGNRLNDNPDNLEVTNRSEHFAIHILINGKTKRLKDPQKRAKKLCAEDVRQIREMRKNGMKIKEIALHFGVGRTAIHDILFNKCWDYIMNLNS